MFNPRKYIRHKVENLKKQFEDKVQRYKALLIQFKSGEEILEETKDLKQEPVGLTPEEKRKNLIKNFEIKESSLEDIEEARQTSMKNSQGVADHSGSSVHGAGRNMDGKSNSSMWQRNFNNHQGN